MRDPKRIEVLLAEIRAYWLCSPDLRLGQIISNINSHVREDYDLPSDNDVFNLEDDDLLAKLQELNGRRNTITKRKR